MSLMNHRGSCFVLMTISSSLNSWLCQEALGFSPTRSFFHTHPGGAQHHRGRHTFKDDWTDLRAIIYGGGGDFNDEEYGVSTDNEYSYWNNGNNLNVLEPLDDYEYGSSLNSDTVCTSMAESLSHCQMAELARMAVAFCPEGHALKLQNIQQIQVVSLDQYHLDISAVVCDETDCVSIFCPVSFPHACQDRSHLEECILENIQELDHLAEEKMEAMTNNQLHDTHADQLLSSTSPILTLDNPPDWWIFSHDADMVAECDSIRALLNSDDFQDAVTALSALSCHRDVEQAIVAAVGPAGACIRATAWSLHGEAAPQIIDLAIPFAQPCRTVQDLRSNVLQLVAQATFAASSESSPPQDNHRDEFSSTETEYATTPQAALGAAAAGNVGEEQLNIAPNWWMTPPINSEMYSACQSVRFLLNSDDYQRELQALVLLQQQQQQQGEGVTSATPTPAVSSLSLQQQDALQYAEVVTVGPAGMILRAKVLASADDDDDAAAGAEFISVTLAFPRPATDEADLYSLVVDAVEACDVDSLVALVPERTRNDRLVDDDSDEEPPMLQLGYRKKISDYLGVRAKYFDQRP